MTRDFPPCQSCRSNERILTVCQQCYEKLEAENRQLVNRLDQLERAINEFIGEITRKLRV